MIFFDKGPVPLCLLITAFTDAHLSLYASDGVGTEGLKPRRARLW